MSSEALADALRQTSTWSEEFLSRLVACPSVTGTSSDIMDLVMPALEDVAFSVETVPIDPAALQSHPEYSPPQLVDGRQPDAIHARYEEHPLLDPSDRGDLLLFAHTDTEPVHDGWDWDPFQLMVRDGRAYGLGVADDKAGVVSIIAAVRAVREAGIPFTWHPRIVLGGGKQGGALGTLPGTLAAAGVSAAVYCHPAESGRGLAHLKIASRGVVQIEVQVQGVTPEPLEERTPVSADPRDGRNAAVRAARLAIAVEGGNQDGTVYAVTSLLAGAAAYEVPDVASFVVACWFTDGDLASALTGFDARLRALALDDWEEQHPPMLRPVGTRANPASCRSSPFARWAEEIISDCTSEGVEDYDWHSASDIRFPMRCLNVPSVGFGASAGSFYGPGEWVDLASMHASTEVIARMLTSEVQP